MERLIPYLKNSTVSYQAAENARLRLEESGFQKLDMRKAWELEPGGTYYTMPGDTSVVAFGIPREPDPSKPFFRMIAAHIDQPGLRIKPRSLIRQDGYCRFNAEIYGGPIYSTWLDRPLSLAGQVTLRGAEDPFRLEKRLVDLKEPVLIIPNLAIHMNRDINRGTALNEQTDMLPIGALAADKEGDVLTETLAEVLNVSPNDIADFDLFAYPVEEPCLVGFRKEFLSAPRLDDLVMVCAGLEGLIEAPVSGSVNLLALWDNEEIGSATAQGADSAMMSAVLEKISIGMGRSRETFIQDVAGSFLISADVAHGIHPSHPEKHDPVLGTRLGEGPVIKISARQSYVTRSSDYSVYEAICRLAGVPVQKFVNRSDSRGGSTMGPAMARWIPCRSMDMGIALLAMHSAREVMAVKDYEYTRRSFVRYYEI